MVSRAVLPLDPKPAVCGALSETVNSAEGSTFDFNYATQSSRSPGSTIKAFGCPQSTAAGWPTDKELDSHRTTFGVYCINNYGNIQSS